MCFMVHDVAQPTYNQGPLLESFSTRESDFNGRDEQNEISDMYYTIPNQLHFNSTLFEQMYNIIHNGILVHE